MWYDIFVATLYTLVVCFLTLDPVYSVTLSVSNLTKSLGMFSQMIWSALDVLHLNPVLYLLLPVWFILNLVHTESGSISILPRVLAWSAGNDCSLPG